MGANTGWVSVGTDHDTAAFAVNTIRTWRRDVGAVHAEVFGDVMPVATMVEMSALITPEHLVEIGVDAYVDGAG